eukprot:TRINITY_DN66573_c2_g1_i1.p1 TRINITY_DN66573_c2_g1~~TRINITY_DN66573_c2_g1_i1.p1  ORF type:complete len:359 (+),score=40.67 TRINITY_DN66573_c2_g1_i1:60-1136(+)
MSTMYRGEMTEWEGSKENIQPLSGGRRPDILEKVFGSGGHHVTAHQQHQEADIDSERQLLEEKLRLCRKEQDGTMDNFNELVQHWIKLLSFCVQNYPKGDKHEHVKELYEQCTSELHDIPCGRHDPRTLQLWLQYARLASNPLDVFSFLQLNQVGLCSAQLYQHWSKFLERKGRWSDAMQVYQKAAEKHAQPQAVLQQSYKAFMERWQVHQEDATGTLYGEDKENDMAAIRMALCELSVSSAVPFQSPRPLQALNINQQPTASTPSKQSPNNQPTTPKATPVVASQELRGFPKMRYKFRAPQVHFATLNVFEDNDVDKVKSTDTLVLAGRPVLRAKRLPTTELEGKPKKKAQTAQQKS